MSPQLNPFAGRARRTWIAGLCLLCALFITLQAWNGRFYMGPDGISYLDMADRLLQGDLSPLVHPYWSPLYPCLLAFALSVFPTAAMEFQAVHIANWLIGLIALASFTFFFYQYMRAHIAAKGAESVASFRCRTGFAYVLFLWGTVEAIGLSAVTPDLCVSALVYLIAGLYCRLYAGRPGWFITSGLLGIALGLASLTKSSMAPLSVALLVLVAIPWFPVQMRWRSLAVAFLGFIIVFGPYVTTLSLRQHRLTYGESGRLNYAWAVGEGIPSHAGWMGQGPTAETPSHLPRLLSSDPPVLEFKDTVSATFPLWYDPSYFHEGLQVDFDFRRQTSRLLRSGNALRWAFGSTLYPLLAGLFVLGCFASLRQVWINLSRSLLLFWSLAAFSMFALVAVEARYLSPFLVLIWNAIYNGLSPSRLRPAFRGVISVTAICLLLFQIHALLRTAADDISTSKPHVHLDVARELEQLGLHASDEIATVGSGFRAFYARLARLRIVATIGWTNSSGWDQTQVLNDTKVNAIIDKLRQLHIKAIVGPEEYIDTVDTAWHSIGDTGYRVLLLE